MSITIRDLQSQEISHYEADLVELLIDAVASGGSVSFIDPLSPADARQFWDNVAHQIADESLHMLVAFDTEGHIVGCVQLALAGQVNAPHRGEVQKLLVHRRARRQGIARQLMHHIEDRARKLNRWLLILDTLSGSDAQTLYEQLDWQIYGIIPEFALCEDNQYYATTCFFKRL